MTEIFPLSPSRFAMWRTIVAMVHADGVITPHEVSFIREYTQDVPMSPGQSDQLNRDLKAPQNVYQMFEQITQPVDQRDFFALARLLCWSDGDFQKQEQAILSMLSQIHQHSDSQLALKNSVKDIQEIVIESDVWQKKAAAHAVPLSRFLTGLKKRA